MRFLIFDIAHHRIGCGGAYCKSTITDLPCEVSNVEFSHDPLRDERLISRRTSASRWVARRPGANAHDSRCHQLRAETLQYLGLLRQDKRADVRATTRRLVVNDVLSRRLHEHASMDVWVHSLVDGIEIFSLPSRDAILLSTDPGLETEPWLRHCCQTQSPSVALDGSAVRIASRLFVYIVVKCSCFLAQVKKERSYLSHDLHKRSCCAVLSPSFNILVDRAV